MSNYTVTILIVAGAVTIAIIGLLFRKTQMKKLPVIDDSDYMKLIPASIQKDPWREARKEIAKIWSIPTENLDPKMALEALGKHFSMQGDSGLDFDTIEEELERIGMSPDEMKQISTVGELLMHYSKAIQKRS